jgi:hypothetical protein
MNELNKKTYQKEWRTNNKARKAQLDNKYADENLERLKAYKAAYYLENKAKIISKGNCYV